MLDSLKRELNPKYDLNGHKFEDTTWVDVVKEPLKFSANLLFKHPLRGVALGTIVGASVGGLCSVIKGDSSIYHESVLSGAILGGAIDSSQYATRYCLELIKRDWKEAVIEGKGLVAYLRSHNRWFSKS